MPGASSADPPRPGLEGGDRDLGTQLSALAGGDLASFSPSLEQIERLNASVTHVSRAGVEHRILLGMAITRCRPSWGQVGSFQGEVAEALGRSERWIRETVRVAGAVQQALNDGLRLPTELCDLAWVGIPVGVENLRQGRELGWKAPAPEPEEPSAEELEAAVGEALEALRAALEAVLDPARRAALVQAAVATLMGIAGGEEPELETAEELESREPSRPSPRPRSLRDPVSPTRPAPRVGQGPRRPRGRG